MKQSNERWTIRGQFHQTLLNGPWLNESGVTEAQAGMGGHGGGGRMKGGQDGTRPDRGQAPGTDQSTTTGDSL